jgi:hypothetical protein
MDNQIRLPHASLCYGPISGPTCGDWDDRRVMIVRDLCPRRYMRASEEEREESNALYEEMGTKEPYPRSIVKSVPLPRNFEDKSHRFYNQRRWHRSARGSFHKSYAFLWQRD